MMRLFALALLVLVVGGCAEPRATDPIQRGRQVFQETNCGSCHRIGSSGGTVGPDLTHIATVAATRKPGVSAQDYITESIRDPGAYVVPGFPDTMPRGLDRGMTQEDFADLVRYLLTLR
jgi:mono/diheme cytochrome c family protein